MLALAFLAVAGWAAVQVWLVAGDLRSARDVAEDVAGDLQDGETHGLGPQVDRLRDHASDAADRTDSLTWRGLSVLPFVGDDVDAVGRVAHALDLVAEETVVPLVATGLDPATFAPRRGRIPLAPIEEAAAPLAQASAGLTQALAELAQVDRDGLLTQVREPYDDALTEVTRAERALGVAARAADLLPTMLGANGRRTYLVAFQNSAEVRSLGGMPGIVTTLTADRGRLSMGKTLATGKFGTRARPIVPLTAEERRIWFDQPGTDFRDAVFIPDFPRASELMAARFAEETGRQVDGVLSVDPAAMSYVVGAAGGFTVQGIEMTQDTFVDELLHMTYLRFPDDGEAQDAFFAEVAATAFDDALGGGADATALVEALTRGVREGRVLLHSFDEGEQAELAGTRIAGELPADAQAPMQVGVYANDSTGSKMSYFLRHDTELEVTACADGAAEVTGRLVARSETPDRAASLPVSVTGPGTFGVPRGVQLDTFTIVGPVGGEIADIEIDGEPTEEDLATYRGRPVAKVPLWLDPQSRLEVTWRMTGPVAGADEVELRTTPGVRTGGEVVRTPLACG